MIGIALLNLKGGVGKTTLATNLAAATHLTGRRTVLMDMDDQKSSHEWFCARQDDSVLADLMVVRGDGPLSEPKLFKLAGDAEVAIFDGPPRPKEPTRAIATMVDLVIVPVRPGPLDWWATADTLEQLMRANETRETIGRPPVQVLYVINAARASSSNVQERREAIEKEIADHGAELGGRVALAPVTIGDRVDFPNAMSKGHSVLTYTPQRLVPQKGPSLAVSEILELWSFVFDLLGVPAAHSSQEAAQ